MGYKIIDATCPMVKEIHKIARNHECRGFQIIVIGDKKHDEVQGIVGQLKSKAIVIDCPLNIPLKKIKNIKKCCVVVQSTQNLEMASEAARILRQYIPRLAFYNTICKPTRIKQDEIKRMPLENDVIIVIGSKNSANTKRLFEIARSFNKKSYWVNSKEEIKPSWFKNAHSVGVAAGASTPDAVIQSVICYLRLV
jgi:4-hydroxy-3-methylbut-2-enyl diphosphate reductase